MERVPLEVEAREPGPSSAARALRRSGKIPGVLYGAGREPSSFAVAKTVLREALTGDAGRHAVLDVKVPGERASIPAIVKEFQLDPIKDRVTHVDLLAIRLDEPIEARATVNLIGEPRGVKLDGGVLEQPTHEIAVFGLPSALIDHVDVDVTDLGVGDSLKLTDLSAPEGLTFPGDLDLVLATVTGASPVEAPEDEAAAAEAAAEAAEAVEAGEDAPEAE
jgi:large subunit ribosomal protein L25